MDACSFTQKEKMTGVYHPHVSFFVQSGQVEISEREKQVMISVCLAMFGIALFGIQCVILFLYEPAYPNYYIPLAYLPSLLSIILSIVLFATTKVCFQFINLNGCNTLSQGYQNLLGRQKINADVVDYLALNCPDHVSHSCQLDITVTARLILT